LCACTQLLDGKQIFFDDARVVSLCESIQKRDIEAVQTAINTDVDIQLIGRENMTHLWWLKDCGVLDIF
jgi:hypothetical protein